MHLHCSCERLYRHVLIDVDCVVVVKAYANENRFDFHYDGLRAKDLTMMNRAIVAHWSGLHPYPIRFDERVARKNDVVEGE